MDRAPTVNTRVRIGEKSVARNLPANDKAPHQTARRLGRRNPHSTRATKNGASVRCLTVRPSANGVQRPMREYGFRSTGMESIAPAKLISPTAEDQHKLMRVTLEYADNRFNR